MGKTSRDADGNLFPGRPRLRPDQNQLQQHEFSVEGAGVWDHYFLPVRLVLFKYLAVS